MRRLTILAALLALVAVACKIEFNVGAEIAADGSGFIVSEVGFDDEARELFLSEGDADPFSEVDLADRPGAELNEFKRDGLTVYQAKVPVANSAEMEQMLGEMLDGLQLDVSTGSVEVSGTLGDDSNPFAGEGGDLEGLGQDVLEDTFSGHVRILMPGKVTSSNADRALGDGTLEWDIPLTGGALSVQAVSDPTQAGGGGGGGLSPILIVVLLAAAAGIIWLVMQNRKKSSGPPVAAAAPVGVEAPEAPEALEPPPAPAPPLDD